MVDPVLTVSDVAKELRCSKAHVYKIIRGEVTGTSALPIIRLGRRKIVRRSSLEMWKQANETGEGNGILALSSELNAARRRGGHHNA